MNTKSPKTKKQTKDETKIEIQVKSDTDVAKEVIAGKWGFGADRMLKLTAAGYDYNTIKAEVHNLLKN